jgi:hypothetical protein
MSTTSELYDQDFYAWALKNAELLRRGQMVDIDLEHVAEEIETMGRSIKRALQRRLAVLLAHLLKWKYQPAFRSKSWRYTIIEQRDAIGDLLEENPSLQSLLDQVVEKAYKRAVRDAAEETELKPTSFPKTCPWLLPQMLDADYWPD